MNLTKKASQISCRVFPSFPLLLPFTTINFFLDPFSLQILPSLRCGCFSLISSHVSFFPRSAILLIYNYSNYLFSSRLYILSAFVSDFAHQSWSPSTSINLCLRRCENLSCYQRIFRVSFLKGQRSVPSSASVPERSRNDAAMLSAKELRERGRFRSFTTFSVFVAVESKRKGDPYAAGPLFVSFSRGPSSGRAPETLHGPRSFISNASDTRALFSTCTRHIHQNVRASCTYTRTSLISPPPFMADRSGSRELALAGFLEDKGVTSLPEIEVCRHDIILTLKYSLI